MFKENIELGSPKDPQNKYIYNYIWIKSDLEKGGKLPGKSSSRIHQINIVQNALTALAESRPEIKLIGINPSDVIDGKPSLGSE